MPHTNNAAAKARKANRHDPRKPAFLKRGPKAPKPKAVVEGEEGAEPSAAEAAPPAPEPSRAQQAALIASFHALEKRLASCTDEKERVKLLAKQAELGGLQAYQQASIHGGDKGRGGETGKKCMAWVQELKVGVPDTKGKGKAFPEVFVEDGKVKKVYPKVEREKLRLLDVGGITGTSYSAWKWVDATYIDINPQAKHVQQVDFFDFPVPDKLYDVIGLSLVLNFVGSLPKRGEMLQHAHSYVKPGGYLFIVLPLPCLTNSRYMNHSRFTSILTTTGWSKVKQYDSAKLTFWMVRQEGDGKGDGKAWKREEVRGGAHRNNFCILVNGGEDAGAKMDGVVSEDQDAEEEDGDWTGIPAEDAEEWGGIEHGESAAVEEEEDEWTGI